jgi:antitoxin (DNA-binding transcriptional repressor) of toxin-antitoxin stability system
MSTAAATFTLEDLATRTSSVLDAVRRFGSAELRVGEKEVFEIKPATKPKPDVNELRERFETRRLKLLALGQDPRPMTEAEQERFNKIIAGEL